jgi:predicted RNase H-like nuclease (RuvC/YqgF family)
MSDERVPSGGRPLVARLAYPVRRAFAPAALELAGRVRHLDAEVGRLREENDHLRARADDCERRLAEQEGRTADLHDGLMEARRLNVRIAELADVVTELVLPLHDREIDPAALASLRPDTV